MQTLRKTYAIKLWEEGSRRGGWLKNTIFQGERNETKFQELPFL